MADGDMRRSHLSYRAFCNAFAPSMHEGTTGSDEKVVEHNVTHEELWRRQGGASAPPPILLPPKGSGREPKHEWYTDSIQQLGTLSPRKERMASVPVNRGQVYNDETKGNSSDERTDMMGGWRGEQGGPGLASGIGREIDWFEHKKQDAHRLLGRTMPVR